MTPEELARRVRVERERIDRWIGLGLLTPGADGAFGREALERARLLRMAARRGITDDQIAAATEREGDILGQSIEQSRTSSDEETFTLDDIAERTGLDPAFVRRLRIASGLDDDDITGEDVAAMGAVRTALDAGFPDEALLQLMRVYADALGRVADAEIRLFHFYVRDRLLAAGVDPADVVAQTEQATETVIELVEPTILYFHRKAMDRALREDVMLHLAHDVGAVGAVGELTVAVLFVDLVGFTTLTETMGDEAAATVLDLFSELVRDEALHCDGRVVKQIGDEFMLVFPDARTAVEYALHLAGAAGQHAEFPALRIGIHVGAALYREADYLGATVNVAARVTGQAQQGQLAVTEGVRAVTEDLAEWQTLGSRQLKGMSRPVEIHTTELPSARSRS